MSSWDEFVHPDDYAAVEEARQKRALQVRAEYLIEMREKAGLTQVEVAEAMGFPGNVSLLSRTAPSPSLRPWLTKSGPLARTEGDSRLRRLLAPRCLTGGQMPRVGTARGG